MEYIQARIYGAGGEGWWEGHGGLLPIFSSFFKGGGANILRGKGGRTSGKGEQDKRRKKVEKRERKQPNGAPICKLQRRKINLDVAPPASSVVGQGLSS